MRRAALRGLFSFRTEGVEPVPLEEVEPATEIVKRFSIGRDVARVDLPGVARGAGAGA